MVATMETITPQSSQGVTTDKLAQLQGVLTNLANVLTERTSEVVFQTPALQRQVVAEMRSVPVINRFGRVVDQRMVMMTREVMVATQPMASAQSQAPRVYASGQSADAPTAPAPQAPSTEAMTTINNNRIALLEELARLNGQPLSADAIQNNATSFRHLAIQTYALVISAQRLSVSNPPAGAIIDANAGSILGLPNP